uniref:Myb/SANT-like DNA-binding domain-containing protein n=1 Tax=Chelonoidis abingdonii TaxID=106734 RepID=A0A8C0FXI3_CHEAB
MQKEYRLWGGAGDEGFRVWEGAPGWSWGAVRARALAEGAGLGPGMQSLGLRRGLQVWGFGVWGVGLLRWLLLWADESVQMELESCLRNQHVFNRIAEVLREKGIHRTGDQCREKIKKMKLEYRRIKDNNKTPRGGRTWKFYEVMDRVLTSRPSLSYSSLSGSVVSQQALQGSMVENYHHHFTPSDLHFGHSQHPELMEIKCEEVDSDEHCLTPDQMSLFSGILEQAQSGEKMFLPTYELPRSSATALTHRIVCYWRL